MPDPALFALFFAAALLLAITPGPGIFYVAARTLAGGRAEGIASSLGTGIGGLVHVLAGAWGVSALVMASAELFTALKIAGALYLVWIGVRTVRDARRDTRRDAAGTAFTADDVAVLGTVRAFREGIWVEALNPKTAAFFLAFLPQFVDPSRAVAPQFVVLGLISVALNTAVDIAVAYAAAAMRVGMRDHAVLVGRIRQGAGGAMVALGIGLLFARRPSA